MRLTIILLSLMVAISASASTDVYIHLASKHFTGKNQNENNLGVGVQYTKKGVTGTVGTFKNSYDKQSYYLGAGKRWRIANNVTASLLVGGVTGYEEYKGGMKVLPIIVPQIDVGYFSVAIFGVAATASFKF